MLAFLERMKKKRYDVFVAFAADAREFSSRLGNRLAGAKLRVFLDERELQAGATFDLALEQAIQGCQTFLFVVSSGSVAAGSYALTELDWARRADRPLFLIHAPGQEHLRPPPALDGVLPLSTEGDRIAQAVISIRQHVPEPSLWWRAVAGTLLAACALGVVIYFLIIPSPRHDMVRIPAGTVELGVDRSRFRPWCLKRGGDDAECQRFAVLAPPRQAEVASFDLDRHEVTNEALANWLNRKLEQGAASAKAATYPVNDLVTDDEGRSLWQPNCSGHGSYLIVNSKLEASADTSRFTTRDPAVCVSAQAAERYCRDQGKRLPTSEEWVLAARGAAGHERWLPWSESVTEMASCSGAVYGRADGGACHDLPHKREPVDVINHDVTPDGVHQLGGNVSEWTTADRGFVARGGGWAGLPLDLHPAKIAAAAHAESVDYPNVGFRCACAAGACTDR